MVKTYLIIFFSVFILLQEAFGQLSGLYTIDPNGSGSANFTSINAASNALHNLGISGHVEFEIVQGTYTEQVTLDSIPGASDSSSITFASHPSNILPVIVQHQSQSATQNWVWKFSNVDWVELNGLVLQNTSDSTYSTGVLIENVSTHITLNRCTITVGSPMSESIEASCVRTNQNNSHFEVTSCILNGGNYGIHVGYVSWSMPNSTHFKIRNNKIQNQYFKGLSLTDLDQVAISQNSFTNTLGLSNDAIAIEHKYGTGLSIVGNSIGSDAANGFHTGIDLVSSVGNNSPISVIQNNCVIAGKSGSTIAGIIGVNMHNSGVFRFVNNSVSVRGTSTTNAAFKIYGGGLTELYNNVLIVESGYCLHQTGGYGIINSLNNGMYSSNGSPFYRNGNLSSLEAWANASGFDSTSLWTETSFVNPLECVTCNTNLDNAGYSEYHPATDIDSLPRSTSKPDIGAHEIFTSASDFGPDSVFCGNTIEMEAFGTQDHHWFVNGALNTSSQITLPSGCTPTSYTIWLEANTAYCGQYLDTVTIMVVGGPNLDSSTHLCQGEVVAIEPCGGNNATYLWSTGHAGGVLQIKEPGQYALTKSEMGCTET